MCDICALFERQLRDCEREIERLLDEREQNPRTSLEEQNASLALLQDAILAFNTALARYEHQRQKLHQQPLGRQSSWPEKDEQR